MKDKSNRNIPVGARIMAMVFGGLFGLIGLIIVIVGINSLKTKILFLKEAGYTEGVVIDLLSEYGRSSSGRIYGRSITPVVSYEVGGYKYTDRGQVLSNLLVSSHEIGKKIGVFYDKGKPEITVFDTFTEKWFEPVFLLMFGCVFTVVSGTLFATSLHANKQQKKLV